MGPQEVKKGCFGPRISCPWQLKTPEYSHMDMIPTQSTSWTPSIEAAFTSMLQTC